MGERGPQPLVAPAIDLTGQSFGRLTVVGFKRVGKIRTGDARFLFIAKCTCGNLRELRGDRLGKAFGCVACSRKEAGRKGGITKILPNNEAFFNARFNEYKANARRRKYKSWTLSKKHGLKLMKSACYYCGVLPEPINGLDRVDNTKGYHASNVVPCCKLCNYAKRSLTKTDFLSWLKRAYEHAKSKGLLQRVQSKSSRSSQTTDRRRFGGTRRSGYKEH